MSLAATVSNAGTSLIHAAREQAARVAAAAQSAADAVAAARTAEPPDAPSHSSLPPGQTLAELNEQTPLLRAQLRCVPREAEAKAGPAVAGDPDGNPPVLSRCDMPRIRSDYQVSDDPGGMVEWKPSGFTGWLARTFGGDPKPVAVTASEGKLLDSLGPGGLKAMSDIKDESYDEAQARFPSQAAIDGNDDHTDAFRHAYWNARMTVQYGQDFAQDYGNAHERVPGNTPNREAMDLHNNEVGRRIASENPYASNDELGDLIEQAVRDGRLVVMDDNGRLVPSNAVGPADTGHEPQDAPAVAGADPARAQS